MTPRMKLGRAATQSGLVVAATFGVVLAFMYAAGPAAAWEFVAGMISAFFWGYVVIAPLMAAVGIWAGHARIVNAMLLAAWAAAVAWMALGVGG